MFEYLVQLVILFFVIFDPLASFVVFFAATQKMPMAERRTTALLAVFVASAISLVFLLFGNGMLSLFNTSLDNFRVAGGVVLVLLGVQMSLGRSLAERHGVKTDSSRALAALIATPLLTGPAAISAIIITAADYGVVTTGAAIAVVLGFTAILFHESHRANRVMGVTSVQVLSTILGLITLAWGVGFIRAGLGI